MPNAREAHDATGPDLEQRFGNDLPDTRALHDDVGLKPDVSDAARVVGRAQSAHELGPGSRLGAGQNVNLQPELLAEQGAQQADRPRSGYEHGFRLPKS